MIAKEVPKLEIVRNMLNTMWSIQLLKKKKLEIFFRISVAGEKFTKFFPFDG